MTNLNVYLQNVHMPNSTGKNEISGQLVHVVVQDPSCIHV